MKELKLTKKEAWALLYAAGNIVDHPDAMESCFPDGRDRAAARRAEKKLLEYWRSKQNARLTR